MPVVPAPLHKVWNLVPIFARAKPQLRQEAEELAKEREARGEPAQQPGGFYEMLML